MHCDKSGVLKRKDFLKIDDEEALPSTKVFLMGCSTVTDPVTDSMTLGLVAKVVESGTKTTKKDVSVTSPRQDVAHTGLSGLRSQPNFFTTRWETTAIS